MHFSSVCRYKIDVLLCTWVLVGVVIQFRLFLVLPIFACDSDGRISLLISILFWDRNLVSDHNLVLATKSTSFCKKECLQTIESWQLWKHCLFTIYTYITEESIGKMFNWNWIQFTLFSTFKRLLLAVCLISYHCWYILCFGVFLHIFIEERWS